MERIRLMGAFSFKNMKSGSLRAKILQGGVDDLSGAQALRFQVFYEEMGATPKVSGKATDADDVDLLCDHIVVVDEERQNRVVGTYRLARRHVAEKRGQFLTAEEFDIDKILTVPGEILELSRSCVDPAYRTRPTASLLWRALSFYMEHVDAQVLFGCASFHGTDPEAYLLPLSYLRAFHLTPEPLRTRARAGQGVTLDWIPPAQIDARRAFQGLPPLLKGYLRAGCSIGEGVVVDVPFNTVDVCVLLSTSLLTERYRNFHRLEAS